MSENKNKLQDWEIFLKANYYNLKWPASFQGNRKVKEALAEDGYNVSSKNIQSWLNKQEIYTLYKRVNSKFKRGRVSVHSINEMYDADLAFMPGFEKDNDNYIGFICVVDILSRFCHAIPIKSKKPNEIVTCLKAIFVVNKPKVLRTDSGGEFKNKIVQKYLQSIGVKHVISQSEFKANYSEVLNKNLKSRLFKAMTYNNSPVWITNLEQVVNSYNRTKHSSHGFRPIEVNENNAFLVQYHEYLRRRKKEPQVKPLKKYKFEIGDRVRINYIKSHFHRQYDITHSGEVFTIRNRYRRQQIPVYLLSEWNGNNVVGTFYTEQLQRAQISDNYSFKIEKILRTKGRGKNKQLLVKWLYYSTDYNSWVFAKDVQNIVKR